MRCGAFKDRAMGSCPACGHRPEGDDRLVAWLLSRQHLDEVELARAAARVAQGEPLQPSAQMLAEARRALFPAAADGEDGDVDAPLTVEQQVALGVGNLLLTPLLGWTTWALLRRSRPTAARQALVVTLPVAAALTAAWLGWML